MIMDGNKINIPLTKKCTKTQLIGRYRKFELNEFLCPFTVVVHIFVEIVSDSWNVLQL